jgi:hypothetical protein
LKDIGTLYKSLGPSEEAIKLIDTQGFDFNEFMIVEVTDYVIPTWRLRAIAKVYDKEWVFEEVVVAHQDIPQEIKNLVDNAIRAKVSN